MIQNLLSKYILIFALCFCSFSLYSAEVNFLNVPGSGCLNQDIFVTAAGARDANCGTNFTESLSVTNGPAGGSMIVMENSVNDKVFKFTKPGTYTITYTISDDPGCASGSIATRSETIIIFDDPQATFSSSTVNVCKGDDLSISLIKDSNTTVTVQRESNGNTVPVSGSSFTLPDIIEDDVLRIIRVRNDEPPNCSTEGDNLDQININVVERPDTMRSLPVCNDDNTGLVITYTLSGGQPPYSLISGPGTLAGNILTTDIVPIDQDFTFQINTGEACGVYEFTDRDVCDCVADAGNMNPEPIFSCASGFASAQHQNVFVANGIERLFFILHENPDDTLRIKEIDWSLNSTFAFNENSMEYDKEYFISAAVAPFVDGEPQFTARCFDMSLGVSVTWLSDNNFRLNGRNQVCMNEGNVLFKAEPLDANGEPGDFFTGTVPTWSLAGNAEKLPIGGDNNVNAYVSFENSNAGDLITLVFQTAVDFANVDETCIVRDSIKVIVKNSTALEKTEIIKWPGSIFSSTDETANVCYQWGYTDLSTFEDILFDGANDRIFYMDLDGVFNFATVNAIGELWVATFTDPGCDINNAECVTYNYYSADIPPGLSESDIDDFSVDLFPNPNDGDFRLDIKGAFRGLYSFEIYNSMGTKVKSFDIDKEYVRAIRDYNLSDLSEGMYYMIVRNEFGKDQIIKTVITR